MKVKHKNSQEIIDLARPNYGKHWNSIYGYLISNGKEVFFFYYEPNIHDGIADVCFEDLTDDYEILK